MHFHAIASSALLLIGSSLAAPAVAADDQYQCFTVKGAKNGETPKFTASCSGTQQGGFKECSVLSINGAAVPSVYANVNIVTDPTNPNDSIPRVLVKTKYTNDEGCRFTSRGHYDATLNCESNIGRKFCITPKNTAIC